MWPFKKKSLEIKDSVLTLVPATDARLKANEAIDSIIQTIKQQIAKEINVMAAQGYKKISFSDFHSKFIEISPVISEWLLNAGYEVTIPEKDRYIEIKW